MIISLGHTCRPYQQIQMHAHAPGFPLDVISTPTFDKVLEMLSTNFELLFDRTQYDNRTEGAHRHWYHEAYDAHFYHDPLDDWDAFTQKYDLRLGNFRETIRNGNATFLREHATELQMEKLLELFPDSKAVLVKHADVCEKIKHTSGLIVWTVDERIHSEPNGARWDEDIANWSKIIRDCQLPMGNKDHKIVLYHHRHNWRGRLVEIPSQECLCQTAWTTRAKALTDISDHIKQLGMDPETLWCHDDHYGGC